ncbi:polyprenyl synthetase family protein [Candidatus Acetothermia bacterium]|nr:MAG: polyprenyl synthetase family protein [Candidatus Acetothermia bacterium]
MNGPRILTRFRKEIITGLEEALAGGGPLAATLRYHVGLEDETGRRTENLGKLLRPSLVLFTASELGADPGAALPAAVGLELVHNFSLIHDDIQDGDRMRRGRPTVWALHGMAQGINAGDLMEAIAVRTALSAGPAAADALLSATIEMIDGQVLDLSYEGREIGVDDYLGMIDRKTGALIRAGFVLGGIAARADDPTLAKLTALGAAIGRAFQIRDDILGIWGDESVTGKPRGSDIRRKKRSLPVVLGISHAAGPDREALREIYRKDDLTGSDVAAVIGLLERLGVRVEAEGMVDAELSRARETMEMIPFSEIGKKDLSELIDYLARRSK